MHASYRLGSNVLHESALDFQGQLSSAHKSAVRPVCLCQATGETHMYVAHIQARSLYELRRMPSTGHKHIARCQHYEPPLSVSGLSQVMGHAVQGGGLDDDEVTLKLDFALSKMAGRAPPAPSDAPVDSVKTDGTKLSLRGLLHYLWHKSHLNRWYPRMSGKRWYSTMQRELLKASAKHFTKKEALGDLLFIPESFNEQRKQEQHSQMLQSLSRFSAPDKQSHKLGLFIGEVFSIRPGNFGHWLKLKSALDFPFSMNEDIHKRMLKHFILPLSMWEEPLKLIAIGSFSVNSANVPSVVELALMLTTENYIPVESVYERDLIDALTQQHRSFEKCLRLNLPVSATLASAVTLDTEKQCALFIVTPSANENAEARINEMVEKDGLVPWLWHVAHAMPALPAPHVIEKPEVI